jgi:predicted Zn-dependent protease
MAAVAASAAPAVSAAQARANAPAAAQPSSPEASAATLTQDQVIAHAAEAYAERLAELSGRAALDADEAFLQRLRRIAAPLIAQAARDYPESASWHWELHTSSAPDQDADCMAGGKLLVGQTYAERLQLSDAELAMLLSHEIAHAVLRHNLLEYQEALRIEPARAARPFSELWDAVDHDASLMDKLAPLGRAQEEQADRAGMLLAFHAGWQPARLAGYYRKLVRNSGWPGLDSATHPSPQSRWQAMHALADTLAAKLAP